MAVTQETKRELVQRLLVAKQKSNDLEMILRFKGEKEKADEVQEKNKKLNEEIDTLLGHILDDWLADSQGVVETVRSGNAQLQKSIRKITQDVQTAQNFVQALGFIDDAIDIASKFVAVL